MDGEQENKEAVVATLIFVIGLCNEYNAECLEKSRAVDEPRERLVWQGQALASLAIGTQLRELIEDEYTITTEEEKNNG